MNQINVSNDFLSREDHQYVLEYCYGTDYQYGENDNAHTPPTGMIRNIDPEEKVYSIFANRIYESCPETHQFNLYRMYVNCFAPSENPYFHEDGERGYTFLYYPQENWQLDDGGETQFYFDGNLYGITPEPNRMVMFDARMTHRATSFRDRHRFTFAIKYD